MAVDELALLGDAARVAGEIALKHRAEGLTVRSKDGGSPVTSADIAVDDYLKARFARELPDHGWLSEETPDGPERLGRRRIVVADPIDGTVAFAKSRPWWCVALAVVEDGDPVAAVIHAPDLDETYHARRGGGAFCNGVRIGASSTTRLDGAGVLAEPSIFTDARWDPPWPPMRFERRNAIAYRMALVAAGVFDAAIALTPKWDWDIAAGMLIAEEAGARVSDHQGVGWRFNRPDPRQRSLICAAPGLHPLIVARTGPIPFRSDAPPPP